MFEENNFWLFFFSIFPAIFYGLIVFSSTPYKSVKLFTALGYLSTGLVSVVFVWLLHWIFPYFGFPLFVDLTGFPTILGFFFMAFIQVALVEETSKLAAFSAVEIARSEKAKQDHPIGTMFYSMMSSTGFAILENFRYALQYGEEVILVRTFTAILLHMIAGILMGYWIARTNINITIDERSEWSIFIKTHARLKKTIYWCIGLFSATFLHGLYDFNLFLPHDGAMDKMWIILIFALGIAYLCAQSLIKQTKEIK